MNLIKKRLADSGFKAHQVEPQHHEQHRLEKTLRDTKDEQVYPHTPKMMEAKSKRKSNVKNPYRPKYTPSTGFKVGGEDEAVFRKSLFRHPALAAAVAKQPVTPDLVQKIADDVSDHKDHSIPSSRRTSADPSEGTRSSAAKAAKVAWKAAVTTTASHHKRQSSVADFDSAHRKLVEEHKKAQGMGNHGRLGTHLYSGAGDKEGAKGLKGDASQVTSTTQTTAVAPKEVVRHQHELEEQTHATRIAVNEPAIQRSFKYRTRTRIKKRRKRKSRTGKVLDIADSTDRLDSSRRVRHLARATHFTETEVASLIRMFRALTQANKPKGEMDRRHFRSFFETTFGITDDVMLDQIFHHFAEENEGSIREQSWVKNLSIMIRGSMDEQVDYVYDVYDLNGDGSLGREEVMSMLQGCIRDVPGDQFQHDDVAVTDNDIVEMIIKKIDQSKLGLITRQNYRAAVKKDPTLLQAFGETLPSSNKLETFAAFFSEDPSNFSVNYSWPGQQDYAGERERYKSIFYAEQKRDPLRAHLAAVNRQLYANQAKNKNKSLHRTQSSVLKRPGSMISKKSKSGSSRVSWRSHK